jgi:hypothetical protein
MRQWDRLFYKNPNHFLSIFNKIIYLIFILSNKNLKIRIYLFLKIC